MTPIARTLLVAAFTVIVLIACTAPPAAPTPGAPAHEELPAVPVQSIGIAGQVVNYRVWGSADGGVLAWAPTRCTASAALQLSTADVDDGHGRKVYLLYARDRAAYVAGGVQPAGQVVVKESWHPQKIAARPEAGPSLTKEGRWYVPGRSNGLFVMIKGDPADSTTDAGWTYATIAPDGKPTAHGKLATCMACHQDAAGDRIFGLPKR